MDSAHVHLDGFNPPSLPEEFANSVSHGVGFVLSLLGGVALESAAIERAPPRTALGCGIFVATLMAVYGASTLSHVFQRPRIKRLLRRWDQGLIYFLIVGTYTPFALAFFHGPWWGLILALMWGIALIGFLSKVVWSHRIGRISVWSYVLLGWLPIVAVKPMLELVPHGALWWMLAGGVCYTVGVAFMLLDGKVRYFHAVWHLLVICGSAAHFFAILRYVVP